MKCFYVKEEISKTILNTPKNVYEEMKDISMADQEQFWLLCLNSKNKITDKYLISLGDLNSSAIPPRIVIKRAVTVDSASVIFVHNHPSGDPKPSQTDIETTKTLNHILRLLDIKVLDHIIVGKNEYYSFVENGDL